MLFIYFVAICTLFIDVILAACLFDFIFGGEDFETTREATEEIARLIRQRGQENEVLYDLGSCRGAFCIRLKRLIPELEITGIDNSIIRVCFSRIRAKIMRSKVKFLSEDIFTADLDRATIFNIYLPSEMLPNLLGKITRNSASNRTVFMYRISFPNLNAAVEIKLSGQDTPKNRLRMYGV